MDGLFTAGEIDRVFNYAINVHTEFVSETSIGKSVQGQDIKAYYLGEQINVNDAAKLRPKILFTGAHDGNDLWGAQMIVKIFLEHLHYLLHASKIKDLFKVVTFVFVPIVNIDAHETIT